MTEGTTWNGRCGQEICPNWSGDGEVCVCRLFDLETKDADDD